MARNTIFEFPPDQPETAARFWRDKTKLGQQVAELKAALARKKAFEAG